MSYADDYKQYTADLDRIYRRAMEVKQTGLSPEQASELKRIQIAIQNALNGSAAQSEALTNLY